jgi:general secretion pathway protein D
MTAEIPPVPETTNRTVAVPEAPSAAEPTVQPPAAQVAPPATPAAAAAAEEIVPAGMIDFRNTPLDQVLTVYADFVKRTLLRPANLPAQQITLTTKTDLTRTELIQALDAVLGLNGITMLYVGDKFIKVVPQTQSGTEGIALDTRKAADLPELGSYVSHVVQLKYTKPTEIMNVLQPFQKIPNSVLPIDSSGIVVLRDYAENVKRMLEMIERVDVMVPAEFISEVIPIKYAKASEIADALNSLSGSSGGTSIGRSSSAGGTRAAPGATGPGGARQGMPGYQGNNPLGQQSGVGGLGAAGGADNSFTGRLRNIIQRASASGDLEILGQTKMIADERSNSLLIFATRGDMDMIKNIVSKLDVVLSQVIIETVILDVQLGNTLNYGVTAGQPKKTGDLGTIGGSYNNSGALDTLSQFFGDGVTNSFPTSSGLTYMGRYKGELDVVVQAAATDSRVNVIQKPRLLTSHARPGTIFVGSTVPYVTSTYYGGGFGGGPSSQYQQLQVGIGLSVTPYINPDGLVVMEIDETIDEVSGSIPITGVGNVPTTTSRKLSAEVAVRDGDTILLGGFIRNSSNKTTDGVPLLKDIPLLGALFSSKSDTKARSELLVLMRPTVLKTPDIAALATGEEKRRLPGVSQAEAENAELEKVLLEREAKRAKGSKSSVPKEWRPE